MIHKQTIPVQLEGSSILQRGPVFYLETPDDNVRTINSISLLLWQLADGSRNMGEMCELLHDQYPGLGHLLDIDFIDGFRALADTGAISLDLPGSEKRKSEPAELCILFLYHKTDEVTHRHLDFFTWFNPQAEIVLIGHDLNDTLESPLRTIDVKQFNSPWDCSDPWRSLDGLIYTWFVNSNTTAKRYLVAEYDIHCTMPIDAAYKDVWHADVAAKTFFLQNAYPEWVWFSEIPSLTQHEMPFAAGTAPFGGMLFSHRALEVLSKEASRENIFSEFRVGTTAYKNGLNIQSFPERLAKTTDHRIRDFDFSKPGVFHPVKKYIDYHRQ